jgi:hypothetical protein
MVKQAKKIKQVKAEVIETTAIEVQHPTEPASIQMTQSADQLIAQAIDKGVSVDTMEKLLAMRRELKAEWALEQFNAAMAKFQGECPIIEKRKEVKDNSGKVLYRYAPLDDINEQTKEIIAKNGFSHAWDTEEDGNTITILCTITHIAGHKEVSRLKLPSSGGTSIMSGPQKVAAALTFGKRYTYCDGYGIMTGDEDVDAAKDIVEPPHAPVAKPAPTVVPKKTEVPPAKIMVTEEKIISDLFFQLEVEPSVQKAWIFQTNRVDNISDLTSAQAQTIIQALKAKVQQRKDEEAKNANVIEVKE